ncbi:MAG: hypothetical protein RIR33_3752 [Pseudomonadota bacterium]|jgi:hypothetical protein
MGVFAISFDPPIAPVSAAASDDWIKGFDWSPAAWAEVPKEEFDVQYHVGRHRFGYCPDAIDGVLGELMTSLSNVMCAKLGSEVIFSVQGYTVLCAEKVGEALQFYDPGASYEGESRLPLERLILAGAPIAIGEVELVLRKAIAAVGEWIAQQRVRSTQE